MSTPRAHRALTTTAGSLLALGSLAACGADDDSDLDPTASGSVTVVASTNVWGDVAAQVGGDLVDVTSVISDASQDPHSFEPDSETLVQVSEAAVVVANGGGYDDFVATMVESSGTDAAFVDAFEVSGLEAAAPEGEEVNEHVWYDLPTVSKVATRIAEELGAADSDHADAYTENAETFVGSLDELGATEDELRAEVEGRGAGVTEPLPVYLMDALGLVDQTPEDFAEAIEEGEDVPVAVLQETLGIVEGGGIDVLLYNDQVTAPVTEEVKQAAEDAGVPVVPITETLPEGSDYLTWMSDNIDAVGAALTGS